MYKLPQHCYLVEIACMQVNLLQELLTQTGSASEYPSHAVMLGHWSFACRQVSPHETDKHHIANRVIYTD